MTFERLRVCLVRKDHIGKRNNKRMRCCFFYIVLHAILLSISLDSGDIKIKIFWRILNLSPDILFLCNQTTMNIKTIPLIPPLLYFFSLFSPIKHTLKDINLTLKKLMTFSMVPLHQVGQQNERFGHFFYQLYYAS